MTTKNLGGSNRMISLRDTAERLGVTPDSFYKTWRRWGIPAYRIGKAIKFRERDIEHWLEQHRIDV